MIVFAVTLGVAVFGNILFRGFLSVIPILIAVIAGYLTALAGTGFYTGSRGFMVCNPEFSGAEL